MASARRDIGILNNNRLVIQQLIVGRASHQRCEAVADRNTHVSRRNYLDLSAILQRVSHPHSVSRSGIWGGNRPIGIERPSFPLGDPSRDAR
jgi:hypothetical protein